MILVDSSGIRQTTNAPKATIDFETRSACDIKASGSWKYSEDPTTEVLCLMYHLPGWPDDQVGRWTCLAPDDLPQDLFDHIAAGGLVEAHNAWFERGIWANVCVKRLGWPPVPHAQWRCSAAKAAMHALPRSLELCAVVLGLNQKKDATGAMVMRKMCAPRKPLKADIRAFLDAHGLDPKQSWELSTDYRWLKNQETGHKYAFPLIWEESPELFTQLFAYCEQDVRTEVAISNRLADLPPMETEVYLLDQEVNERGFAIDGEAVDTALTLIAQVQSDLTSELVEITGGEVQSATQRAKMAAWFRSRGLNLPNTQASTLERTETDDPQLARALVLMRQLGKSSTAKYLAARNWRSSVTGSIHGGLLYHGATTGRWSGAGLQPHNFPRGVLKGKYMEPVWDDILANPDAAFLEAIWGHDPMTLMSSAIRGIIVPHPGKELVVADFSAIEARTLPWLAGDEDTLDIFRARKCIYMAMASDIYGYPVTDKEKQADERQMGKQAVLGLGYQMGAAKFRNTLSEKWNIHITEEFAQKVVQTYRQRFHKTAKMWWDQEKAAMAATRNPGRVVDCGKVKWLHKEGFLMCKLPSGRKLYYPDAQVKQEMTSWGEPKAALSYMSIDAYTRKWSRTTTYGGMIVENINQAVARDLMAAALVRAQDTGKYDILLSVHDEAIAEAPIGQGDAQEFEALLAQTPAWAAGCPVAAEGWKGMRYRK